MECEKKLIRGRICKNKWILRKYGSRKIKANNRKKNIRARTTQVLDNNCNVQIVSNSVFCPNSVPNGNGYSEYLENASSPNGLSCDSDVCGSEFDGDGKLCNAIKIKLKALNGKTEHFKNSNTLISMKGKSIHTSNSGSSFTKDCKDNVLSTKPSILTDDFLETSQLTNVETSRSTSVLTLFSNSMKCFGDVEIIDWEKNDERKGNSNDQNKSDNEEFFNSYYNRESHEEFLFGNSSKIYKTESRRERMKVSRNEFLKYPQSTMIQNSQPKRRCTVDSTENICLDSTDVSDCLMNSSIVRLIHVEKQFCVIVLTYPNKLFFYGKVKAMGLHGSIEVLGYPLNEDFQDVYSARTGCALCFETFVANDSTCLFRKLRNLGVSIIKSEEIATRVRPNDGVLVLKPLENTLTSFISKHCKRLKPFSRKGFPAELLFTEAEEMLKCNLFTEPPKQHFSYNSIWRDISANTHDQCITLIAGGKNAGKSTFLRYYVNRTLASQKSIAVIDLDPGQSEFTIATSISVTIVHKPLLGANFTHLQNSIRMYTIGVINVMDNLELYVSAVRNLFIYCKSVINNLPWVINTMGMTDDAGLQIISHILTLAMPDTVIQLDNKNNFPIPLQPAYLNKFWQNTLGNRLSINLNLANDIKYVNYKYLSVTRDEVLHLETNTGSAKYERYLNILAYFSQIEDGNNCSMLSVTPFIVSKEAITIATTSYIPDENINSVINGKLVALCSSNSVEKDRAKVQLFEENLVTYGYGLIRAVDPERNCIYLNTPVKKNIMSKVDTLVYLECLPDLCSINESTFGAKIKIPYNSPISIDLKQRKLMKTPQRRFNLLQLLKMKPTLLIT